MFDKGPHHHIQKFIIGYLMTHQYARFSDLRPPKVDTNLFTYHLKLLQKSDYIKKTDAGYTLSRKGLLFVDRVTAEKIVIRNQPKIITMLLIQDGYGKVLLQRRTKQPYINTWTLPYGKLHIDDASVLSAATREAVEKLVQQPRNLRHVGDCYIRVVNDGEVESATLAHIVRGELDELELNNDLQWIKPLQLGTLDLAPAVEQIVARSFFGDAFFCEEFVIDQKADV